MGYLIKEQMVERSVQTVIGADCDNCGMPIQMQTYGVAKNAWELALVATFDGYFDSGDLRVLLCKECADRLVVAFPAFKKALK